MRTEAPPRIVHLITGLELGGAEMMLYALVRATERSWAEPVVVSLSAPGPLQPQIEALGVQVHSLASPDDPSRLRGLSRLPRLLRALKPDLVQTWMYHADLIGGLATRLLTTAPVVWGLHNSNLDPRTTKWTTRATVWSCARLSRLVPRRILSCSQAAMRVHVALGYDAARMVVIPNGFDTERFRPDPSHYAAVRQELGLAPAATLIGLVARLHPQKDHGNFIAAAGLVARRRPLAHFVLIGTDVVADNPDLGAQIQATGTPERFHLLGARADLPRLTAAFDIGVTASAYGEAFPLVVGEAMACGVPCVVTDVGDSALMVADTGRVVPPRDPAALAAAIESLLDLPDGERRMIGTAARARICAEYALPVIAQRYHRLYDSLLARGA